MICGTLRSYLANPSNGNRYAYAADNPVNYIDPTGAGAFSGLGEFASGCAQGTEDSAALGLTVSALGGPELGAADLAGGCLAGGLIELVKGASPPQGDNLDLLQDGLDLADSLQSVL